MLQRLKLYYDALKGKINKEKLQEILKQHTEEEFIVTVPVEVDKIDKK